jgi:cyclophilin family peptidyl-prolyl cis-trans isomerase
MNSKFRYYGLLTIVALVYGCNEATNMTETNKKVITSERNIVNPQDNVVKLQTSMGNIVIELNEQAAPVTVKNFLGYVQEGFYDDTIFHRVIPGFMIQGGGFTPKMIRKKTLDPIINEAKNSLSNKRGTIAMARTNNPNSATSQFFINHRDNDILNYMDDNQPGYAAFGKVIEGMDVVDAIASVKTTTRDGMENVPVEPVVIVSAKIVPK